MTTSKRNPIHLELSGGRLNEAHVKEEYIGSPIAQPVQKSVPESVIDSVAQKDSPESLVLVVSRVSELFLSSKLIWRLHLNLLELKFRYWKWMPHALSYDEKRR
jgi:hypothetical protein